MNAIHGYKHLESVHEFSESKLFRAQNKKNGRPVLLKLFEKKHSKSQFTKLKKRVLTEPDVQSHLILNPLRVIHVEDNVAMTWEDTGYMFLSIILLSSKMDMERFLEFAIQITQRLGELHSYQIVHNDLRPQNILVDEKTGDVKFIGFSFLKSGVGDYKTTTPETMGEDQFVYTSPEQTGRISWDVDQKSDLYSLGVTFYEMLTSSRPFDQSSPQKRIQNHLVQEPEKVLEFYDVVPPVIREIVFKLLSKSPEDRYQSAFGLLKDLEVCKQQYQTNRWIQSFDLAQKDNIEQLSIPSKLYGSQSNFISLIETFNRVSTGSVEMMIVEGQAGMGKTTLISELLNLVDQRGAYVGRGKCEKEFRDTPYYSLVFAIQILIRRILKDEKERLPIWKEKFLEALGHNGQLVIDFIPEVESIIGPQPPVPKVDADESQNRLNHIFRRFIQAFTSEGNPIVFFLDGFHWADLATIQLIQTVLSDVSSRYIMLIIAYQKHLVCHAHSFAIALDEISQSGTSIDNVVVNALQHEDICLLIEEALRFKQEYDSLADYILEKTGGNPYFVKQYLTTLHDRHLIQFNPKSGQWDWDLKAIEKAKIPKNVVDLMAEKVKELPEDTVEILKLASCLGTEFDLKALVMASEKDEASLLQLLKKPMELGLLKTGYKYEYKLKTGNSAVDEQPTSLQFSHSRVLKATYSLLTAKERKTNHLKLGRMLINRHSKEEIEQNPYQIVNQMNQSINLIRKQAERHELASLNLLAGQKSKSAAAFETAWKYFSIGSELLTKNSWEKDYELSKELYLKRSECEYFIGNTEAADPIFHLLLQHIKTNKEKVDVIILKLNLYIKNNQLEEAIEIGEMALASLFNEEIPPNDAEITIVSQIMMQDIQSDLERRKIDSLLYLPEMVDKDKIAMMYLIGNIIPAAYRVRRNLWILLTLKMVETSLNYGNSKSSSFAYMNYAVILCSGLQDYSNGYDMGKLALDLNSKVNNYHLESQLNFLFGSYIGHWKNEAFENINYLKRSHRAGVEYGDFISAGLSIDFLLKTHLIVGSPLEELQKVIKKHHDFIDQMNNPDLEKALEIAQVMTVLREKVEDSEDFLPDKESEYKLFKAILESKSIQLQQWYFLVSAQLHYLFYDYYEALKLIQESDKLIASYSQLAISEHYFYYSLIIVENYEKFSDEEKKKYWDILKNNHQRLSSLAEGCSINFSDKSLLVSALMSGISGNYIKAGDLFDEAIQKANDNGFAQIEAIANELAAKYYLSKGKETIATAYIRKACLGYIKWGALRKLSHLEAAYPMLLKKRQRFDDEVGKKGQKGASIFSDITSIVSTSQEISKIILLKEMIHTLLTLLIENTNTEKAFFLMDSESHLKIQVKGVKNEEVEIEDLSVLLEEYDDIAHSVVFYVIRTRKMISLDDASKDGMFAYNNYIKKFQPKSILCLPIIHHNKLNGVVYLENTKVARAYSPKLLEMISKFISQVSVSFENTMLYTEVAKLANNLDSSKRKYEKRIQVLEQELESRIV